jgi:DNA invertase Pin-like site-specific DNA recombinase
MAFVRQAEVGRPAVRRGWALISGPTPTRVLDLYLHQQGLDMSTPAGKAMFQMLGVFAEFERAMIVERVQAGLRRAKAQGKRLGRPRVPTDVEQRIRRELTKGTGIRAVARKLGVGVGTVQRVKTAMAA